jgi:pimeloyl-ACP methyl ester carboxylesterase
VPIDKAMQMNQALYDAGARTLGVRRQARRASLKREVTMTRQVLVATVAGLLIAAAFPLWAQAKLDEAYFDSAGVRIRYAQAGRGEPVVLVHSMSDSIEMWRDMGIIDALAKEFRVIAFDSRGHGKSDKPHDVARYGPEIVEDVRRLMDHLQLRRAHVFGYSMGGYVAGRFAASYPERVVTVTFGGSSVMSPGEWAARFEKRIPLIADGLEQGNPRPLLARQSEGAELEERARELAARNDLRALAAFVRSFGATRLTVADIAALRMPILLVTGSNDLPESRVAAFAGLAPAPQVVIIEGATHGGAKGALQRVEFPVAVRAFLHEHPAGTAK